LRAQTGGWDAAQEARGLHPACQRCRVVAMGAGAACVAPLPHAPTVRHGEEAREEGDKVEKEGADRRVPHVSGCGVRLVVSGLAGCVGPKGLGGLGGLGGVGENLAS
jgi:hypothetical protein